MSLPFIVIGDKTDHGGEVVEAAGTTDTHGKRIARVGDRVTCPKRNHGPTTIVSGDPTMIIDGKPAARHGDKCACGATLIASQMVSTTGGTGGGGNSPSPRPSSARDGASSPPANQQETHAFDQHFVVRDRATGKPLANIPYRISLTNGHSITGKTDSGGLTSKIGADMPLTATLEVPYYGDSGSATDTDRGRDACSC